MKPEEFDELQAGNLIKLSKNGKVRRVLEYKPQSRSIILNKVSGIGTTVYCSGDCKNFIKLNKAPMIQKLKKCWQILFGEEDGKIEEPKIELQGTAEEKMRINKWLNIAKPNKWEFIEFQYRNRMISWQKEEIRLNIYYTTNTAGVCVPGKRQNYIRRVTDEELADVFKNIINYTK